VLIVLVAVSAYGILRTRSADSASGPGQSSTLVAGTIIDTTGIKHIVPLDKVVSGGVPMDGIPSIDRPKFISAVEGGRFLSDAEIVFGLFFAEEARAYPAMILAWHEIVNDIVNGQPVLITYCPLCYASIAYERTIDGEVVQFGVSGKNSTTAIW